MTKKTLNDNWPQPNAPMHWPGYISPDGKLYSCPSEGHRDLASGLVLKLYPDQAKDDPEVLLDQKGWLRVQSDGWVSLELESITQSQLNVLGDLFALEWQEEIPDLIKHWPGTGHRSIIWCSSHGLWQRNISAGIRYYSNDRVVV